MKHGMKSDGRRHPTRGYYPGGLGWQPPSIALTTGRKVRVQEPRSQGNRPADKRRSLLRRLFGRRGQ